MNPSATGRKIAALRNQKGMTQKELAELCQVDIRTIQRIESGDVKPRKHTLKLLSTILECDFNGLPADQVINEKIPVKQIKPAIIGGIIFSTNAIPVVFDLIRHSLSPTAHLITVAIHIASCIFFYRGLYQLGKAYRNQVMEISFLLLMILLPLINILELLKPWYFNPQVTLTVFIFLCISVIFSGIGILSAVNKHKESHKSRYYKLAGLGAVIQGALFLSPDFTMVSAALISSFFTNFCMLMILYSAMESTGKESTQHAQTGEVFA
jgi:DNA-binding XRE family transcriptional regulator